MPSISTRSRSLLPLLAVVVAGVALALWRVAPQTAQGGMGEGASSAAPPVMVETLLLEERSGYPVTREYLGRMEPRRRSALGFELGGLLTEVLVDEGEAVVAGQALARLDTARLRAERVEAEARRAQAQAELELAELTAARQEELLSTRTIAAQQRDEAVKRAQALAATVRQADAQIARLDVDIEKSELRSPFAGVVGARLADEGAVLAAGQQLLEVLEKARPEARVSVPAVMVPLLEEGSGARLRHRGTDRGARVRAVLPTTIARTRTVDVLFVFPESDFRFQEGDVVRLLWEEERRESGFRVPLSALTEGVRGLWSLYVAVPDRDSRRGGGEETLRAERREVEVLYQNGEWAFVRGVLESGDRLIASGLQKIVPGSPVATPEEGA